MKDNMYRAYILMRKLLMVGSILVLASCGSGGGSDSGSGDDGFPTPKLPASAAKLDNTNANTIADAAVGFLGTLDSVAQLKTANPPSMSQVIKLVVDRVIKRSRSSGSVAARVEDISAALCVTGSAIADFDENANNESGTVSFSNCDIGGGILVNDSFIYDSSWNDTTLAYDFHMGGTISFDFGTDLVTIVMNLSESGNNGTGDFTSTISFSLSGIPDGGFLVTTTQTWTGNAFSFQVNSGQLIVYGSDNTRLRITVTGINTADVDLDNGSGTFVFDSTINF
jgi:hypothetical protein